MKLNDKEIETLVEAIESLIDARISYREDESVEDGFYAIKDYRDEKEKVTTLLKEQFLEKE